MQERLIQMKDLILLIWEALTGRLEQPRPIPAWMTETQIADVAAETYRRSIRNGMEVSK